VATKKQVTEPAEAPVTEPAEAPVDQTTEPAKHQYTDAERSNELVRVRDANTGKILDRRVPRSWLDGRFPQLKEVPSNKKGK